MTATAKTATYLSRAPDADAWLIYDTTNDEWWTTALKHTADSYIKSGDDVRPLYADRALIEELLAALKQVEAEMRAGFGSPFGETREQIRRAIRHAEAAND